MCGFALGTIEISQLGQQCSISPREDDEWFIIGLAPCNVDCDCLSDDVDFYDVELKPNVNYCVHERQREKPKSI